MKNKKQTEYYILIQNPKNVDYYAENNSISKLKVNKIFAIGSYNIIFQSEAKIKTITKFKEHLKNTRLLKVKFITKSEAIEKIMLNSSYYQGFAKIDTRYIKLKVLEDLTKEVKSNLIFT